MKSKTSLIKTGIIGSMSLLMAGTIAIPSASASPVNDAVNFVRASPYHEQVANTALVLPTSWIVTLGARLNPDCSNPDVLEQRLNTTAKVAKQHPLNPILVSGGATQPGCQTEAQAMKDGLIARGISPHRIVLDNTAGSTVGNAQAAARIAGPYGGVLVTSPDHMNRALNTFDQYAPNKLWLGIMS